MTLQDRKVVVVGASAGIGRAFAIRAAKSGAVLVAGARRRAALAEVRAAAGAGETVTVDVCDGASRDRFVTSVGDLLGEVDLVLCTVGYAELRTLADTDDACWERTMATNVVGTTRLLAAMVPLLSRRGVLSVLSSETATVPRRGLVPYAASKAALEATLKGFRAEHPGVRLSCVVVGATYPTEFGDRFGADELGPSMASWQTHGLLQEEYMDPDDVAGNLAGLLGAAVDHPGVCVEHVVLRSPSPVIGAGPSR